MKCPAHIEHGSSVEKESRADYSQKNGSGDLLEKTNKSFELVWIDVSGLGPKTRFILCTATVLSLFLLTGYILEYIFLFPGFKTFGWFFTFLQFCIFSFLSVFEILLRKIRRRYHLVPLISAMLQYYIFVLILPIYFFIPVVSSTVSIKVYMLLALVIMGSIGFTNASLEYLNYPAHIMFKTCNQIPVMIGGILILKKKYQPLEYIAVLAMCVGLIWFTLASHRTMPDFNIIGVVLICSSLVCNALLGNIQEKVMKTDDVNNVEMLLFTSAFAAIYMLVGLITTNKLIGAASFCSKHPIIYVYIVIICCFGYVGNLCVLTLVQHYGALIAATVTTCRKALSILLSFLVFTKPFNTAYIWSGLLVVTGIYLNIISKSDNIISSAKIYAVLKKLICKRNSNSKKAIPTCKTNETQPV